MKIEEVLRAVLEQSGTSTRDDFGAAVEAAHSKGELDDDDAAVCDKALREAKREAYEGVALRVLGVATTRVKGIPAKAFSAVKIANQHLWDTMERTRQDRKLLDGAIANEWERVDVIAGECHQVAKKLLLYGVPPGLIRTGILRKVETRIDDACREGEHVVGDLDKAS